VPSLTTSGSPTFGGSRCALDTTDRLQLPANLFDETQGWLAFRIRMGFASTGGAAAPRAFEWADGAAGDLQCGYDTGVDQWYMYRDNPGGSNQVNSATQSFASGDDLTIVVAWRSGQISISVNGANFVTDATAQHIPTLVGTFDIGNSPGANRSIESSYWWAAGGNGTLSNADAATIHAFGNGEPDTLASLPGTATFLWRAISAEYDGFPTTSVLDNFNRANGAGLGANWGTDPEGFGYGTFDINSNQAKPNGAFPANYWSAQSFNADCEVYATIAALPPSGAMRLIARQTTPGVSATEDNYELEVGTSGGNSYISRTVNGSRTTIKTTGVTFAVGDQMGLRCVGDQIIAFKNGVEIDRVTDATNTAGGYIGMVGQNDSAILFDDFGGGNYVPVAKSMLPGFITSGQNARGVNLSATGVTTLLPGFLASGQNARGVNLSGQGSVTLLPGRVASGEIVRGVNISNAGTLLVGRIASGQNVRGVNLSASGTATLSVGKVGSVATVRGVLMLITMGLEATDSLSLGAEGTDTLTLTPRTPDPFTLNPE